MGKNKYRDYENARKYVTDKNIVVNTYIDTMLNRLQSMFKYDGLPKTIPQEELERLLQVNGDCIITIVNGELYALNGACGGELDMYYRPTQYLVSNPYLNLNKTYTINKDCVYCKNDFNCLGVMPTLAKYATLLCDSELSLNTASILARITLLLSACDDKTKASAELFVQKIMNGELSVIGETAFFDGVRLQTASTAGTSGFLTQLIETIQYYKASAFNEIGLNANYNMKRETLNDSELALNIESIIPLSMQMLNERQKACELINEMYNTNIQVDFNTSWKATAEHLEKEIIVATTEPTEEASDEPTEEASDEPMEESSDEPMEESSDEPMEESSDEPMEESSDEPMEETNEGDEEND